MNLLIVGDVHGCYHTFKQLVEEYWNPQEEILIQIGDLINKGPHSGLCLKYWFQLQEQFPYKTLLIRGNHEQFMIGGGAFLKESVKGVTLEKSIENAGLTVSAVRRYLQNTPLKWENEDVLVTHAGVSKTASNPYSLTAKDGVLFNKGALKRMDKLQVKGHSIVDGNKPLFSPSENAWYIDTGAWMKKYLSAIRLNEQGEKLEVIRLQTLEVDKVKTSKAESRL
jgi:serine/threonine protein phosphatase 1